MLYGCFIVIFVSSTWSLLLYFQCTYKMKLLLFFSFFLSRVNTCPYQGSRTIRTEEAVLISLARFRPFIQKNVAPVVAPSSLKVVDDVQFSDDASDESDDEE
jgi:uncharacterized membrane protein